MNASQRGIVLVIVLLSMTLLSAVGLGLMLSASVSRMSAANHDEAVALLNACESALELAFLDLAASDLDDVLSGKLVSRFVDGAPGSRTIAPGLAIDLMVLTSQLTCGRTTACSTVQIAQNTSERPWGANNPRWQLFLHQPVAPPVLPSPAPPIYAVVWIGDDAREDDDDPIADGAGEAQEGRYILRARAEAFGPRGGRQAIEAEIVAGSGVQSWRAVSAQVP